MCPIDCMKLACLSVAVIMLTSQPTVNGTPYDIYRFRIYISPRAEECFFLTVDRGEILHFLFRVVKGGDRTIKGFIREDITNLVVRDTGFVKHWGTNITATYSATYMMCVDNKDSLMTGKLVEITSGHAYKEDVEKYKNEVKDLISTSTNITTFFESVDKAVADCLMFQSDRRSFLASDYMALIRNHNYVQLWSMVQCVAIIASSGLQVYFVRRLFRTPNVTPTRKPRA